MNIVSRLGPHHSSGFSMALNPEFLFLFVDHWLAER